MDSVKMEKEIAMRRYRKLRQVGLFFRCAEAGAILLLLTWTSARLPAAAKFSGEVLKSAISALTKPRAVFLIGNAIVILLFSGKLSSKSSNSNSSSSPSSSPVNSNSGVNGSGEGKQSSSNIIGGEEIYDVELIESKEKMFYWFPAETGVVAPAKEVAATGGEAVVYEDKLVCLETRRKPRECRRSKSQKLDRKVTKESAELRRAESEISKTVVEKSNALIEAAELEEEDAEEFRRTVEAFIAKQQKFQRDESLAGAVAAND